MDPPRSLRGKHKLLASVMDDAHLVFSEIVENELRDGRLQLECDDPAAVPLSIDNAMTKVASR